VDYTELARRQKEAVTFKVGNASGARALFAGWALVTSSRMLKNEAFH
jgi:hypothetical protein